EYEVEPSDELLELADSLAARAESAQSKRPELRCQRDRADPPRPSASPLPVGASLEGEEPPAWRRTPTIAILRSATAPGADRLEQLTQAFNLDLISTLCRFKEWTVVTACSAPMMFATD